MFRSAPKQCLFLLVSIVFFTLPLTAQDNYESQWNKVEKLASRNKPGAAFEEARSIYEAAHQSGNDLQAAKALLYMSGLYSDNTNKNRIFSIQQLEKELVRAKRITKPVLQSMLAESYWIYWKAVRYQYYSRPDTVPYREYDLDTWNSADYHRKISSLYWASVSEEKLLQQTSPDAILPILASGNARILRPSLYDLLAFRAFDYFEDDERDIRDPAYALDMDLATAFAPADEFIERLSKQPDTNQTQHPALLLLRKLISFHLHDSEPAALIDADIHRIEFVNRRSTHPDKQELYIEALNRIRRDYGDHPAAAQASYLRAEKYNEQGNKWRPFGADTWRYEKIKANQIIDSILLQERMSEGKNNAANLLIQMQLPELNFVMEQVNIPGQPFRVRVKYKNTPLIHLRIVPFSDRYLSRDQPTELTASVCTAKPVKEWQQSMPSSEDMLPHSAEIKVDGIGTGKYVLLIADQADMASPKTTVVAQVFYVTSISIIRQDNDCFLVQRETGQPLAGADVQVWEKYNASNTVIREKGNAYRSDSTGFFRVQYRSERAANTYNVPLVFDVRYKDEQFMLDDYESPSYSRRYRPNYPQKPLSDTGLFLFTDRSIYRPGQTVYFKGIALAKDSTGRKGAVVVNKSYQISLINANRETIHSLVLETNEFGSISGSFRLPVSGLNGVFHLEYEKWKEGAEFRVEEYKRPTFITQLDPVKGKYLLHDSITITGFAKAYAGNAIDGARVSYRVFRRARFLYDWYWRNHDFPYSREEEMTNGEIFTDENGKFHFSFKAIPDTSIVQAADPVFDYSIQADVTDINGETRSAESVVSVSYQPFIIKTDLPDAVALDKIPAVKMQTQNLNGEFVSTPLTISFTRIQDEKRLIRNRYWERTDQFTLTKNEYLRFFPHDEYNNESVPTNRPLGETETVIQTNTVADGNWVTPDQLSKLNPGYYLVTISAPGSEGSTVSEKRYVELYTTANATANYPVYWRNTEGGSIKVGDSLRIVIGSSADSCYIIQQTSRGTTQLPPLSTRYQFHQLNDEKKTISFTPTYNDQGGFGLSWTFVKHNRMYTASTIVQVPWSGKELQLEYASFRDKTTPGSEEQWKIIIRGDQQEKVAAEILAGMYDASLDQLYPHYWSKPFLWPGYMHSRNWSASGFKQVFSDAVQIPKQTYGRFLKVYDELLSDYVFSPDYFKKERTEPLWWINPLNYIYSEERNPRLMRLPKPILPDADGDGIPDQQDMEETPQGCPVDSRGISLDSDGDGIPDCKDTDNDKKEEPVKVRKNFNETAFFFPHLQTDSTGAISFSFTMPESLTQWKFQAIAHTKDLDFGYSQRTIITQKTFMVQPNAPRFIREKDKLVFSAKLVNLSGSSLKGTARLELIDEATNQVLDSSFHLLTPTQAIQLAPGKSMAVIFLLEAPASYNKALTWRITARTTSESGEKFSDGEQNNIPVLPHRMLVSSSLPLYNDKPGTRQFQFNNLLESKKSSTLRHFALTTEYSTNPAWYAIQSLPYLMEFPYECAEQTWNRYYANALASVLIQSAPEMGSVFAQWAKDDSLSLQSGLDKNPELKSVLQEETPWLNDARNEREQKRRLLGLFQKERTAEEMEKTWFKLQQLQTESGGFSWFKGGPENLYITQYIVAGIGHLKKLVITMDPDAWSGKLARKMEKVMKKGIAFMDNKLTEDYAQLKKNKQESIAFRPSNYDIQRLYARSFFTDSKPAESLKKAMALYAEQATLNWTTYNVYIQGMITLINYRMGEKETAAKLLQSLRDRSTKEEEQGMFWVDSAMQGRYYWYQAPVETQSLLIEAFLEAGQDTAAVNAMRTWLIRHKQTNSWSNTKATAEACYALLLPDKTGWNSTPAATISLGSVTYRSDNEQAEAGSGYFKKRIEGTEVTPEMGRITVTVSSNDNRTYQPGWGAVHWQYFEDMDKISNDGSASVQLKKKLFIEKAGAQGPVLVPVTAGTLIRTGDKIKVQLELQASQDMEFVHLRDQRAAAFEPVKVLSGYNWRGNLGWYESTRDASTDFFIDNVPRGKYVIEYTLFATHAGTYSNGMATVQCMYAPEFTAHSESIRVKVE
ncbi:MAG: MG2 domain-containing protein [Bacteroidetes bacterium]|nr:MG2 domain-containing protein [Bacteroidota bacterium]